MAAGLQSGLRRISKVLTQPCCVNIWWPAGLAVRTASGVREGNTLCGIILSELQPAKPAQVKTWPVALVTLSVRQQHWPARKPIQESTWHLIKHWPVRIDWLTAFQQGRFRCGYCVANADCRLSYSGPDGGLITGKVTPCGHTGIWLSIKVSKYTNTQGLELWRSPWKARLRFLFGFNTV